MPTLSNGVTEGTVINVVAGLPVPLGFVPTEANPIVTRYACYHCQNFDASNNHVRRYYSGYMGSRNLCTRCRNAEYITCRECGDLAQHVDATNGYCRAHRVECNECETRGAYFDHAVCNECGWVCTGCGEVYPQTVSSYYDASGDYAYCAGCAPSADADDDDDDDDDGPGEGPGVRSYGHTHPSMWFGGPLPRDESNRRVGYYLGMELEIYSRKIDATPILDWERTNGMQGFFDCKEDSSVEGFEIATQPFTPAFFEQMVGDGRLDSFFEMLNTHYPLPQRYSGQEPERHGLHVHIGRVAFLKDDVGLAAFCYLLGQDEGQHLERIARRDPTNYCERVRKPVSSAIVTTKRNAQTFQQRRLYANGIYPGRDAINFGNGNTVEVRAFRSTRSADELAAAIRLVYVAAEYARYLRRDKTHGVDPKKLVWSEFCRWAAFSHPDAFASLVWLDSKKVRRASRPAPVNGTIAWSGVDFEGVDTPEFVGGGTIRFDRYGNTRYQIDESGCVSPDCCPSNFTDTPRLRGLAAV